MMRSTAPTIGLVVPTLETGGGVPAVARFVNDVALRSNFQVKVISLATSADDSESLRLASPGTWHRGATVRETQWRGAKMHHVGAVCVELEFQRYRPRAALTQLLVQCDIVQVVCGAPAWANSVVNLGKPVSLQVATLARVERRLRGANGKAFIDWWRRAMTQVTNRLDHKALCAVNAIQLENPWMLEYAQNLNRGRTDIDIRYAPPGIDAGLFRPLLNRSVFSPSPYILCVGRLNDPRKNPNLLLEAFGRLANRLPDVHLVTAGLGGPPSNYWARVEALGLQNRVRHVDRPETASLVKLYQQAAVIALSSDEEGLGVVILEAMACGVPVVATRCGGPEGIITEGKDGFLVPLDDAASMADRLALLCTDSDLNRTLGLQARKTIESRYSEDVAGQAFVDVWERLLQQSRAR